MVGGRNIDDLDASGVHDIRISVQGLCRDIIQAGGQKDVSRPGAVLRIKLSVRAIDRLRSANRYSNNLLNEMIQLVNAYREENGSEGADSRAQTASTPPSVPPPSPSQ